MSYPLFDNTAEFFSFFCKIFVGHKNIYCINIVYKNILTISIICDNKLNFLTIFLSKCFKNTNIYTSKIFIA